MDLLGLARQGGFPTANMRLRLRPDLGAMSVSSNNVSSWTDAVGSHAFTESTNFPVYGATTGPNSTPAVTFTSGSSQKLRNTSFAQAWYALNSTERDIPWTALFVVKSSTWGSGQSMFYTGAAVSSNNTLISSFNIRSNGPCQVSLNGTSNTLFTPSSGVWNAILIQRPGGAGGSGQGSYWRDSAGSSGTWDTGQSDGVGTPAFWESYLGTQPNSSVPGGSTVFFASMVVAELVIWSSLLNTAQTANVRSYVAARYAL